MLFIVARKKFQALIRQASFRRGGALAFIAVIAAFGIYLLLPSRAAQAYNPDPYCQYHVMGSLYGDAEGNGPPNGTSWDPNLTTWSLTESSDPVMTRFERCAQYMIDNNIGGNGSAKLTISGSTARLTNFWPAGHNVAFPDDAMTTLVNNASALEKRAFVMSVIEGEGEKCDPADGICNTAQVLDNYRTVKGNTNPTYYLHVTAIQPIAIAAGLTTAFTATGDGCTPQTLAQLETDNGAALCIQKSDYQVIKDWPVAACARVPGYGHVDGYQCGQDDAPAGSSPAPTATPTPSGSITGDINGDGKVDVTDLSMLLAEWSTSDARGDLNHDGVVNVTDLSLLLGRWGQSVTPSPSPSLKPVAGGLFDRQGVPDASVQGAVKDFVINIPWATIQPNQATGTNHGGTLVTSTIDSMLATAQTNGELVRLRITAGINAPNWAKTLDGPAMTWYDRGTNVGTLGRFWTSNYNTAYVDMMTKLAAKYDTNPLITDVTISQCATVYSEPFILQYDQLSNLTALQNAGFTVAADKQCQQNSILNHAAIWKHTRSSLAFNPYQVINDQTFAKQATTTDEAYTESMMRYCRQILAQRCILGNDSMTDVRGTTADDPYTSLYATIKSLGGPIYIQTDTNAKIGDWRVALQRSADIGAGDVELPVGYRDWGLNDSSAGRGLIYYEGLYNANDAPYR